MNVIKKIVHKDVLINNIKLSALCDTGNDITTTNEKIVKIWKIPFKRQEYPVETNIIEKKIQLKASNTKSTKFTITPKRSRAHQICHT